VKPTGLFFAISSISGLLLFQNCSKGFDSISSDSDLPGFVDLASTRLSESQMTSTLTLSQDNNKSATTVSIPNFGFHMGEVGDNRPLIEESLDPTKARSPWYFAQWKKIHPLRPSQHLSWTNSNNVLFDLKAPNSNESSLNAIIEQDDKVVYRMTSKQGYLTSVGGSNIFLATDLSSPARLNRELIFQFDTRLREKSVSVYPEFESESDSLRQQDLTGFFIGGFPMIYNDGNPDHNAGLFVQFYVTDTRMNSLADKVVRYRGYYPHNGYTEIVATLPISEITGQSSDLLYQPSPQSDLKTIRFSLNRLLCQALSGSFIPTAPGTNGNINFATAKNGLYVNNLAGWTVGSLYLGLETQAAFFNEGTHSNEYFYPSNHTLHSKHDVRQDIKDRMINNNDFYKGDITLTVDLSDVRIQESTSSTQLASCRDISENLTPVEPTPISRSPTPPPVSTPPQTPSPSNTPTGNISCDYGVFLNDSTKVPTEWMCHCTDQDPIWHKGNWISVGNGCSHRSANSFCSASTLTYYVCDQKRSPISTTMNWLQQTDGCYHLATEFPCK
jgi:hypothetical protein